MRRPFAALIAPLYCHRLFRPRIPKGHTLTVERQRLYALPTRYGLLFSAMLVVMLLGAINYNNSLGFLLTFLLTSVGILSILYTYRNIAHLRLRAGKATSTFAGNQAHFTLHLHNAEPLPRCTLQLTAAGAAPVLCDVAANDSAAVELALPAPKRGRLALGRITLSTTYPLGLVRAWAYVDLDMRCLVYPRPGPYRPHAATPHSQQGKRATQAAGSDDFLGFRPYHPGDSLRHVHWKALARHLPLMTKRFSGGETPDLWLDWAVLPRLDNEARLRLLCRLVLEAERGTQGYGLRLPGLEIAPGRGPVHQQRCLEALALFGEPTP